MCATEGEERRKRLLIGSGLVDAGMLSLLFQNLCISTFMKQTRDETSGQHVVNERLTPFTSLSFVIQRYRDVL